MLYRNITVCIDSVTTHHYKVSILTIGSTSIKKILKKFYFFVAIILFLLKIYLDINIIFYLDITFLNFEIEPLDFTTFQSNLAKN